MPFFGRDEWDPKLIVAQICVLQSLHYLAMGLILGVLHTVFSANMNLGTLFDHEKLSVRTAPGWVAIVVATLTAPVTAFFLHLVVERAKKCFDFSFTIYFLHLFFCLFYKVRAEGGGRRAEGGGRAAGVAAV
eukprot:g4207.t1